MTSFAQSTHKIDEATAKFVHKLTSRKLPTAKHMMQRRQGGGKCSKCGDEESFDHLFQCASKEKWRRSLFDELKQKLVEENTETALSQVILEGVESWLCRTCAPESPQSAIGWREFTIGFFHEKIIHTQRQAYDDPARANGQAMKWARSLRKWLWSKLREAWYERNQAVHNQENPENIARATAIARLELLYSKQHMVDTSHRTETFKTGIATMRRRTTNQINRWLECAEPAVERAISAAREKTIRSQPKISVFFRDK
jgi:hypothetical protein